MKISLLPAFNNLMNNRYNLIKWNISKIVDINYMLYKHNSLLSLPDIFKRNVSNNINEYNILDNKFKFLNYQNLKDKVGLIDNGINEMNILEFKKYNINNTNYIIGKSKKIF